MADRLGISACYYCQLENERKRLSYENAFKIAKIFNSRPDSLFYDTWSRRV